MYLDIFDRFRTCFEALMLDAFPALERLLCLRPIGVDAWLASNGHSIELLRFFGIRGDILGSFARYEVVGVLLSVEFLDWETAVN
jgi:hypothetical protein